MEMQWGPDSYNISPEYVNKTRLILNEMAHAKWEEETEYNLSHEPETYETLDECSICFDIVAATNKRLADTLAEIDVEAHNFRCTRWHRMEIQSRWDKKLRRHEWDGNILAGDSETSNSDIQDHEYNFAEINRSHQFEMDYINNDILYQTRSSSYLEKTLHYEMWLTIYDMYRERMTLEM
jgi:hypothetical protein